MDEKKLYQVLDNIGKRNMPDTLDILPTVQQQIMQRKQGYPSRWYQEPIKLVASVMTCLLLVATTVYAVTQWSIHDPALNEDIVTEIGLSQTIDDTTVYLEWAYADANRIVLSYSIADESGELRREQATDVVLTDDNELQYQYIGAFYADFDVPEILTGNAHFDASIIEDDPQSLDLQFSVLDRFIFDFTVPFISGVRIEKQPDVEVNGVSVSLEWAVISPSMTRIRLCYEAPGDEFWVPGVQLAFDGQRVALEAGANYPGFSGIRRYEDARWCRDQIFLAGYEEQPQEITVTVTHLQNSHLYSKENMRRAAEILAGYGIEAIVMKNEAQTEESYLLSIPNPPDDAVLMAEAWEDAMQNMGDPIRGERIEGPWIIEVELP